MYVLYPWIHQCDNNLETEHQMQCISFPDINPAKELPQNAHISMAAGDFLQVHNIWVFDYNVLRQYLLYSNDYRFIQIKTNGIVLPHVFLLIVPTI